MDPELAKQYEEELKAAAQIPLPDTMEREREREEETSEPVHSDEASLVKDSSS